MHITYGLLSLSSTPLHPLWLPPCLSPPPAPSIQLCSWHQLSPGGNKSAYPHPNLGTRDSSIVIQPCPHSASIASARLHPALAMRRRQSSGRLHGAAKQREKRRQREAGWLCISSGSGELPDGSSAGGWAAAGRGHSQCERSACSGGWEGAARGGIFLVEFPPTPTGYSVLPASGKEELELLRALRCAPKPVADGSGLLLLLAYREKISVSEGN